MGYAVVTSANVAEVKRAVWRYWISVTGRTDITAAQIMAGTRSLDRRKGVEVAERITRRPFRFWRDPQTGDLLVHVDDQLRELAGRTIGGDRVRLGTEVDRAQLAARWRNRLDVDEEGDE